MLKAILIVGALTLTTGSAWAQYAPPQIRCAQPDEQGLTTHKCYTDQNGVPRHGPTQRYDGTRPSGARTPCSDGTYSYSSGSGTCSHHGGIAR
jgi:hypothetical protein